jgi:hypothetical protein
MWGTFGKYMKLFYTTTFLFCLFISALSAEETPKDAVARLEAIWKKGTGSFNVGLLVGLWFDC